MPLLLSSHDRYDSLHLVARCGVWCFLLDMTVLSLAQPTLKIAIVTRIIRAGLQNESSWFQAETKASLKL
jgi:hypothetical protein